MCHIEVTHQTLGVDGITGMSVEDKESLLLREMGDEQRSDTHSADLGMEG